MGQDAALLRVAAKQHQVFTLQQAISVGVSARTIQRGVEGGIYQRLHRSVYCSAAVQVGWKQQTIGACLACGPSSAASYDCAEVVWAFADRLGTPHVTVRAGSTRSHPGIEIHRVKQVEAMSRDGIRVTTPMRTLLDLAGVRPDLVIERYVDSAHRRGLVAIRRFEAYLAEPAHSCRPGAALLRELLADRDPDRPIESDLETLLFAPLRACRLPLPVPQYWVETRHGRKRIDFAYPDHKLALEADSWDIHGSPIAFEADRARQRDLEGLGWHVFPFTWKQLRADPIGSACDVGLALGLRPVKWRPR
jgi:very-short-patch-repair endonuclease